MTEGLIGIGAMLLLMALRVPIALAMALVGVVGLGLMRSWAAAGATVATEITEVATYMLSVVPMFVLMGNFVTRAGMSRELYRAAYVFIGHLRGGLAMSTIVACAGFGAICGSSVATTATMSRIAVPQMRLYGYDRSLAVGSVCAGGTLGILIPPSVVMVIYCIATEQSIGGMFAAGVIPGIVATLFYLGATAVITTRNPRLGPAGERSSSEQRWEAVRGIWRVVALFAIVMGGMYGGFFTPTEAAGVGASGGLLFALLSGNLSWTGLREVLSESARTSAMLFAIVIGASLFSAFVNFTTLPNDLREFITQFQVHPIMVIVAICIVYLVLGTAMEAMSMMLLTLPIFFPVITHLGFDPIWFGILVVCMIEISMISPPVGMNLFVVNALFPEVSIRDIWRGVMPFVLADALRVAVLIAFPAITLFLPQLLKL
jgi:tripartite ATP-independent transporter DctM subunit